MADDISSFVRTDLKAVEKNEPLSAVQGWLMGQSSKLPIVVDNGRPFGIVNERALMGRHMDLRAHVDQFTLGTRAIQATATIEEARARMAEHRAAYLPVEDKRGKLVGYIRAIDLAREETNAAQARELAVPVTTLREEQTMGDALHIFNREYVDFLPVVRSDGRISGVLSRAEILKMEFNGADKGRRDRASERVPLLNDAISGFMDEAPSFVAPTADMKTLFHSLDKNGYAIVGSAQGGQPVGVVTPGTLFRPGK